MQTDTFDAALMSPRGSDLLAQITRLYLIIQGRPPDSQGLRAYIGHLHGGTPLRDLAEAFLASEEFKTEVGFGDPRQVLCRNALGTNDAVGLTSEGPLSDLAVELVFSPDVARRLPVQPALFPDGLLLCNDTDYRIWLAGRPDWEATTDGAQVSVSFVVPAHPDLSGVAQTIGSVLKHSWPKLEVVVTAWHFRRSLQRMADGDKRVRLVRVPFWYSTNQQFNYALKWCKGTFTGLIVAGEQLDFRAAPPVTAAMKDADIVLCDEDSVDDRGLRHDPRLAEAWDPDRMLASGRPGLPLIRTQVVRKVGGMRRNGTPWELLLDVSRQVSSARITHVPSIWLSRPVQALKAADAKQVGVAKAYLDATGAVGYRVVPYKGTLRIIHPLPPTPPRASIVITTRNRVDLLAPCMDGLLNRTDYPDIEVVIVDNGSDELTALALLNTLAQDKRVRVLFRPGPFNWSALNNAGVAAMSGEVAILLNNDTDVIEPGWLRELVSQAIRPGVGAVGAKLLYPDYTVQHAGVVLDTKGHALHMWRCSPGDAPGYLDSLAVTREVTAVTGACLAIRREVYESVGGCDAEHLAVTWNDIDLCLRIRAKGLRVIWTPHARLLHLEQASRGSDSAPENDARFRREQAWMRMRWKEALVCDPFLNANLLPSKTTPRLAVHQLLPRAETLVR